MFLKRKIALVTLFVSCFCVGCFKSEYRRAVDRELATGERHDSLFLGIKLGMERKDFYAHCWELNKKKVIKEGLNNTTVLFKLKEMKDSCTMEFYPKFEENKIYEMPVTFIYMGWAPWNGHLHSDRLQLELKNLFEKWYGPGFMEVKNPNPKYGSIFVKVDGNRRITLFRASDSEVKANFTDLHIERKIREANEH